MTAIPLDLSVQSVIKMMVEVVCASQELGGADVISVLKDSTTSLLLGVHLVSALNMLYWMTVILMGSALARMALLDYAVISAKKTSTTYQSMVVLHVIVI